MNKDVILVVYDIDNCITLRPTWGNPEQQDFETPYEANLRLREHLVAHIAELQNSQEVSVVVGLATFNENEKRIGALYDYLKIASEPRMMFCKNKETIKQKVGKNEHIYELIKLCPNGKSITKVILVDDDLMNIAATKTFAQWVLETYGEELDVSVKGILMPKPDLFPYYVEGDEVGYRTAFDKALKVEVTVENPVSQSLFRSALRKIKHKVLSKGFDPLRCSSLNACGGYDFSFLRSSTPAIRQAQSVKVIPLSHSSNLRAVVSYGFDEEGGEDSEESVSSDSRSASGDALRPSRTGIIVSAGK